jgi:6-pyruvoyltetrahydropterin/6-carboxytetrahydropterin synthase
MKFTSNKVINLGSAAFRQWRSTHSHCQFIHGYNLTANITFEANELDNKGWVADFGGLKDLKTTLEHTFDHKLVVAADDPEIELLRQLDDAGVAEVVVLPGGVGCERFAEHVLKTADTFIDEATEGRVRVASVQINEHGSNFATCHRKSTPTVTAQEVATAVKTVELAEEAEVATEVATEEPAIDHTAGQGAATVGGGKKSNSMSNPFAGTSWGA